MLELVQIRDVIGPLIGGALGYLAARSTSSANERIARDKQIADDHEAAKKDRADVQGDLTQRFRVLMEGYEGRIRDLTAEVQTLRAEVARMRDALDARSTACAECPYYRVVMEHKLDGAA